MPTLSDSRLTFSTLFDRFSKVEIPIIQRDYAQGRDTAKDVRTGILEAIREALDKEAGDSSLPLDLDFIYGSTTSQPGSPELSFSPLDGQQRLTTLFILHWFTAWIDGEKETFQEIFYHNDKCRFSYLVRPSSEEFFDELSNYFPDQQLAQGSKLSKTIGEQPWFFLSWKHDPTIQSALTVLDAIQEIFAASPGCFTKLLNREFPFITFQYLELDQFGLSDDLYIKMNARGKPLTVFENFKARLEQRLKEGFPDWSQSLDGKPGHVSVYFNRNIEAKWSDLFWNYRDKKTQLFDSEIMNLFRDMTIISRPPDEPSFERTYKQLRDTNVALSYQRTKQLGCNDKAAYSSFFSFLDQLSGSCGKIKTFLTESTYLDEEELFKKSISPKQALTYEDLLILRAYSSYLHEHQTIDPTKLAVWMRVISNLAKNTIFNRTDDFQRALRSLNNLQAYADDILNHIAQINEIQGFNEQQIKEEKLKAQLILSDSEWSAMIHEAEKHSYFKGQIEFLFKFSGLFDAWSSNSDYATDSNLSKTFKDSFKEYESKAVMVFNDDGLRPFDNFVWERALLAEGDYLLKQSGNYSFLVNDDRNISWKRLLRGNPTKPGEDQKREFIKQLLDKLNTTEEIEPQLIQLIEEAEEFDEPWREYMAKDPLYLQYCENRMIRWHGQNLVYLLKRLRMSGQHAELFSLHLYHSSILPQSIEGNFTPYNSAKYNFVATSGKEPHILLDSDKIAPPIKIYNSSYDSPTFNLSMDWSIDTPPADQLVAILSEEGFTEYTNEHTTSYTKTVETHKTSEALLSFTEKLQKPQIV